MRGDYNVFLLVGGIKGLTFNLVGHKYLTHALHDSNRDLYWYYHVRHTTRPQYLGTFKNNVSVITYYDGSIGSNLGISKEGLSKLANLEDLNNQEVAEATKSKYLGVAMLCESNQGIYGKLLEGLQNYFTKSNDSYPANTI